MFIGGEYLANEQAELRDSYDPSCGQVWYQFHDATTSDVNDAVNAAQAALENPEWKRITQTERGKLIRRLAQLIEQNGDGLAEIETRDNGKLISEMRAQVSVLPDVYHYFAGMADKIQGETIPVNKQDMFNFTLREPIGVVALIVPWNSPLYLMSSILATCLAIGNTVVIKPSEHTSASAIAFSRLINEAGFPPGVVNILTGYGPTTGAALASHPGVSKVAFTGGVESGKKVAASAATHLAACSLELGGKSPHVVFDDADFDRAVNGVVAGIFAAAGQTCIAGSRCFVHQSIHDDFIQALVEKARDIRIGDPVDEETQLGPLALSSQLDKVKRYVQYGKDDGGKLIYGGKQPSIAADTGGWYFEPTIFSGVSNSMRVAREEIFGPVLGILSFKDEDELMAQANDTDFGLAAGIWTQDIDRAMRFCREIHAGTVWINTYRSASFMSPFGGFKQSGYGKHNGYQGIQEYSRLKNVVLDYSGKTQNPFVIRLK